MRAGLRQPSHAGSWYSANPSELRSSLTQHLAAAASRLTSLVHPRAIIGPHAGLSYCAATGAYGYCGVDKQRVRRVFLLGPCHHVSSPVCSLPHPSLQHYGTPLGPIPLDTQIISRLRESGRFGTTSVEDDEEEHSLELHLPYIAHVMSGKEFTLVPVMVGSLNTASEADYGRLFAPFLDDAENLFIVSSDFCHWGERFGYTYVLPGTQSTPIHSSIKQLDELGMRAIESMQPSRFSSYLGQTKNTICGRHPIGVLLNAVATLAQSGRSAFSLRFLDYSQSSQVTRANGSSVSYAAGVLTAPQ